MAFTNLPEPRAHLDGLELPDTFKLPDLNLVWQDAQQAPLIRAEKYEPVKMIDGKTGQWEMMPECLYHNHMHQHLFKFAYFCDVVDVPTDLISECFWALETFVKILSECSDFQLRKFGHILPHQKGSAVDKSKLLMITNARNKAGCLALYMELNEPEKAAMHFRAAIKAIATQDKRSGSYIQFEQHFLEVRLGTALARTRGRDEETRTLLERWTSSPRVKEWREISKIYLARVYARLGQEEKAREMETISIKYLKKNPHAFSDRLLIEMFTADIRPNEADPILEALGGRKWLDSRRHTRKTDHRTTKKCMACEKREPDVKLSQCSRCKHIYYCSKPCQKKDWLHHKASCNDMATTLKRIETLRLNGDSDGARRLAEWKAWRCEAYDINGMVTGSALNLYKDRTRGLKYILLKLVEHVPNAKRPRDQFRVLSCGVFKIADIYPEIEAILALNPGEGPEFIAETLKEAQGDRNPAVAIAFFDLTWGENIEAWLGCSPMYDQSLRVHPYNSEWRKAMNKKGPVPTPLKLVRTHIKDAEYD